MTSKQRKTLRAIASVYQPIMQVGKGGINENLVKSLGDALEKRELIKLTVLNNAGEEALDVGEELAEKLSAELVCAIGHKVILYRRSKREDVNHVEF